MEKILTIAACIAAVSAINIKNSDKAADDAQAKIDSKDMDNLVSKI